MIFTGILAVKGWLGFVKTKDGNNHTEDFEKNFTTFSDSDVECHIPHQYRAESSLKSEIVSKILYRENVLSIIYRVLKEKVT
jgi:hypothetical protein